MKRILLSCLLFLIISAQDYSKAILEQANIAAKALIGADYKTLIKYTYPKLVMMMGGEERFVSMIEAGRSQMATQGTTLEGFTMGTPTKVVEAGNELHALVPQALSMKVKNGKLMTDGYLIAVSQDKGSHWYFLDTSTITMDNVKLILPNYNMSLVIPEKKPPKFSAE